MKTLTKVLESQVEESDSSGFQVRDQIERNLQYYSLQRIGNEQPGRSHYISPDVHDYVESKKALFSRTFLSNRQVVKFIAGGNTPDGEAEAKTAYVNRILKENDQEELFHDLWHDAFLSKRAVLLCEWVDDTEDETIPLPQPMPQEAIQAALGQDPTVIDINTDNAAIQQDPMGNVLMSGEVVVTRSAGRFEFTVVPPENYYRDPMAPTIKDAMWCTIKEETPRGTLVRRGYDYDLIMDVKPESKYNGNNVEFSRQIHDGSYVSTHKANRTDDQEEVEIYKTWTWINMSEIGEEFGEFPDETRLYEIHWSGHDVLKWANGEWCIREADKMPFFEWSELRLSHAANGMCGADVVAHTQKVNSVLKRAIIDNQQIRNNSRFEAVHDLILNPRDLVDNTTGGVIFTEQIGAVQPLPAPELSPVTFNVLQMMKEDSEMRSGLSSLTKGMNTAVLENQNAKDMVERLTNAAGSRPSSDARSFAQTFLIPLFKHVVECGKKYDQSQSQTEASGKMIAVIPQSWQGSDDELEVAVALTPDEAEAKAQQLLALHSLIMQDPVASSLYGLEQRHALLDDVFESMGVSDTSKYMMRPDSPEFQQKQMQEQQMQQQMQEMQMQIQQFQMQLQEQQVQQGWAVINNDMMDKMEDNQRADTELSVETRQGDRELDIKARKGAA
jgi:hypothetical protein